MAQLVARLVRNEKVGGSNPPSSTISEVCPARKLAGRTFFDVAAAGSRRHDRLAGASGLIVGAEL